MLPILSSSSHIISMGDSSSSASQESNSNEADLRDSNSQSVVVPHTHGHRRIDDITRKLEHYRLDLQEVWAHQFRSIENRHVRKISKSLNQITTGPTSISSPKAFLALIEQMLALQLVYDEKQRRKGLTNKILSFLFANYVASKSSSLIAAVSLTATVVLFGFSTYSKLEGKKELAILIIASLMGIIGLPLTLIAKVMNQYYHDIYTPSEKKHAQEAFARFMVFFLDGKIDECEKILDNLPIKSSTLLEDEVALRKLLAMDLHPEIILNESLSSSNEHSGNKGKEEVELSDSSPEMFSTDSDKGASSHVMFNTSTQHRLPRELSAPFMPNLQSTEEATTKAGDAAIASTPPNDKQPRQNTSTFSELRKRFSSKSLLSTSTPAAPPINENASGRALNPDLVTAWDLRDLIERYIPNIGSQTELPEVVIDKSTSESPLKEDI